MQFVMYLSGKTKTPRWHREHDSTAAVVNVPKDLKAKVEQLIELQELLAELGEQLAWINTEALNDLADDIVGNGPTDPLYDLMVNVQQLCRCECDCGYVHIVQGRA